MRWLVAGLVLAVLAGIVTLAILTASPDTDNPLAWLARLLGKR